MYQHDLSTEEISPGSQNPNPPPQNLTSIGRDEIQVKVEPTLTRLASIEGGRRRVSNKQKVWRAFQRIGEYLKANQLAEWYGFKVAVAMGLSSSIVLIGPTYKFFGVNSLWLVISVLIIYEPVVGNLLNKGLLRMIGTAAAIVLSLVCSVIAEASKGGEIYVVTVSLVLGAFVIGFVGQVSPIKGKYDYAVIIALLTFGLLTASEYRTHYGPKIAGFRLLLIIFGFAIACVTNICIKPNFAGNKLHTLVSGHFSKQADDFWAVLKAADWYETFRKLNSQGEIATSLKICVQAYLAGTRYDELQKVLHGDVPEDDVYNAYRSVIISKTEEDSLVVTYEPPHGQFHFKYPWHLYKDLSRLCRHCMYTLTSMDGCLRSEFQCPVGVRQLLAGPMIQLAEEASKALEAMGESVTEMKVVNLLPFMHAMEVAALDLQRELQAKAGLLIIQTPEADKWVEKYLDDEDERARSSLSSSKPRRSAVESADGKRPSTEDDESVEFSFPIVHIDETSSEEGFPHSDSYGHQSRVTPERGLLQSTPSDLQERHRPSVELTYVEPPPPVSRQGSIADRINRKTSSRQLVVPVPGGVAVLSLVQFACNLVELAAKLQLLVNCVNNLSEKAGFTGEGKMSSRRGSSESTREGSGSRTRLESVVSQS